MSEPICPFSDTLGVCVLATAAQNAPRTVQHSAYVHELLGHVGLAYSEIPFETLEEFLAAGPLRVLLTIGEVCFSDSLRARLTDWVTVEGGTWVSAGGLCGMTELIGAEYTPVSFQMWGGALHVLGEGFLKPNDTAHPIIGELPIPLHYFGGIAVTPTTATVLAGTLDAHHRSAAFPAVLERRVGAGRCILIAPDITGSIVRIQQGIAVTRDGVSCPDGSGPVSDGVLKSDDGQVLDWLLDREPVPGVPGFSAFLQPVADQWRDLLVRTLLYAAAERDVPLALLWYWPRGLPAVGHLSHDTDNNGESQAYRLLETLKAADAHGTWCVILPGYSPEIIDAIRAGGHELALHFDAMSDGCPWGEEYFDSQWRGLCTMFGTEYVPVTNKNHYLRWEGDTESWDWCIARGVRLDQSKGASKTGEAGFNFGTCHLYRPATPQGNVLPIHEMATVTQDLLIFAPEEFVAPLLAAAVRHYGVLHLLFHPAHIDKPGVADSLIRGVAAGRRQGLEWWTGRELVEWEEARRVALWSGNVLTAAEPLRDATVLRLDPAGAVERWGFHFTSETRDLAAGARWIVGQNE